MHPRFSLPLGVLLVTPILAAFALIFWTGYVAEITQRYLSPFQYARGSLCDIVSISNSGTFLVSTEGYWEGSQNFSYSTAIYQLQLLNTKYTMNEYIDTVKFFQESTEYISTNISVHVDLAMNLIYWMSYVIVYRNSDANRFHMFADPAVVFNREYVSGAFTSIIGDCSNIATAKFDKANAALSISYYIEDYEADSICSSIIEPETIGFASYINPYQFNIELDVRSFITAVAINLKILSLDSIQQVRDSVQSIEIAGVNLTFAYYVDPRYPGMSPILCSFDEFFSYCILNIGGGIASLPIFIHTGSELYYPAPCNCEGEAGLSENANNPDYQCNRFYFLAGLLFYNITDPTPLAQLGLQFNYSTIQSLSLYPMFAASPFSYLNPELYASSEYRNYAYQFCQVEGYGTCNFLVFTLYDLVADYRAISSNYYPLETGSCKDSFSIPTSSW
jgi:hypothetical protein